MGKEFYSTGEVARLLDVSAVTIFRAISRGRLRASTTPGGHYRVNRKDLEFFLKENKVGLNVLEPRTKRVLIVEDNPAELRMLQRLLGAEPDLEVKGTTSGYEAGYLTKSFQPDLLLLDIFLKDVDGREVVRLLRSDPVLKDTKIVAITGARDPKDLREIRACGVQALIRKPIQPEALRRQLRSLLE